jgi:hypothetical protein
MGRLSADKVLPFLFNKKDVSILQWQRYLPPPQEDDGSNPSNVDVFLAQ